MKIKGYERQTGTQANWECVFLLFIIIIILSSSSFSCAVCYFRHGVWQVWSEERWLDVAPRPGDFIVNIGDFLQQLSNNVCLEDLEDGENAGPPFFSFFSFFFLFFFSSHFISPCRRTGPRCIGSLVTAPTATPSPSSSSAIPGQWFVGPLMDKLAGKCSEIPVSFPGLLFLFSFFFLSGAGQVPGIDMSAVDYLQMRYRETTTTYK
jgi:hypothetical protein